MEKLPISVIVPMYNSSNFIIECIESINAGVRPDEIIVIDDASQDGSFELVQGILHNHSNIKLLCNKVNRGAAESRRKGIQFSANDFIALVDSDDLIEINSLKDAYSILKETSADICIFELWRLYPDGSLTRSDANPMRFPIHGKHASLLTLGSWGIHPLGVSRKQIYLEAYESLNIQSINSDEILTRIVFDCANTVVSSSRKYFYRLHMGSTTNTLSDRYLTVLRSQAWLVRYAFKRTDAPLRRVVKQAISTGYSIFKKKSEFSKSIFRSEMTFYLNDMVKTSNFIFVIIFIPKSLLRLIIMMIYTSWIA